LNLYLSNKILRDVLNPSR